MKNLETREIWYITGSQHLYGDQTVRQVAADSEKIVRDLSGLQRLSLKLLFKSPLSRAIRFEPNQRQQAEGVAG
jgi:L-arabinose isomerase